MVSIPTNTTSVPSHPYYPLSLQIPNYIPNEWPMLTTLSIFGGIVIGLFTATMMGLNTYYRGMKRSEKMTVWWFILCSFLHCIFEGYFVLHHTTLASSQAIFAQLWKEYSLSDSRYLTSSPLILTMEFLSCTLLGPLSLYTAYLILSSNPLRYPVQIMVCVGHIYGLLIYYGSVLLARELEAVDYSRPEHVYWWVYFWGLNAPWMVVSVVLLMQSLGTVKRNFEALRKIEDALGRNGRPRTPVGREGWRLGEGGKMD